MSTRTVAASRLVVRDFGTSLVFSGSAGVITAGTTNPFTGSFYFATWVKWGGVNGNFQTLFAKRDSYAADQLMFSMSANNTTGNLTVDTVTSFVNFGYVLPVNRWVHLVWVHDVAGSKDKLYINGELVSNQGIGTLGTDTAALISIGACEGTPTDFFNGKMDEIVIGSTLPSADDVFNLYAKAVNPGTVWRYFKLDEGTGTTATDSSSNATNGTITGATYSYDVPMRPRHQATPIRYGLELTKASSHYVDLGSTNIIAGQTNASLVFWMKTQNVITGGNELTPYSERPTSGNDIFKLEIQSTGRLRFTYRDDAATLNQLSNSASRVVNDNVWHHIALIKSGTAISVYVDGRLDFTGTLTATDSFTNGNQRVRIGGDAQDSAVYYGGKLAGDFKLYRRAISATEVQLLYRQLPITETSLRAHYKFTEQTGTSLTDYSGNSITGTLTNSPSWSQDVMIQRFVARNFGTCVSFDGVNDVVTCGNLSLTEVSKLSIALWIKIRPNGSTQVIVARRFDLVDNTWVLEASFSSGRYFLNFNWGSGSNLQQYTTNRPAIPVNKWVHVGVAIDFASPSSLDYYLNGVKTPCARSSGSGTTVNMGGALRLGLLGDSSADFLGFMDEVAIYDANKLTEAEMQDICFRGTYRSGLNRHYKFDEGSGTSATDSSGNSNTGTLSGATYSTAVPMAVRDAV